MPNVTLICQNCKKEFLGRANRLHCSVPCRREFEMKRRIWERQARHIRWLELNGTSPELHRTPKQREHWLKQADAARALLPPRP
jgi:hypothetical protein